MSRSVNHLSDNSVGTSGTILSNIVSTDTNYWVNVPLEHQISSDDRLMAILNEFTPVRLSDTEFSQKLSWCLEHCQSKFRDVSFNGERVWYFNLEEDATLFALRWA